MDSGTAELGADILALVRARAAEHTHNLWQGLLHDEVAAAFRAAATPGVGRLEVRCCARQALAAVEDLTDPGNGGPTDLMPALHDVAATATARGTVVEVDGPCESDGRCRPGHCTLVVPAPAATAILGAVLESVRNVERHAAGARTQMLVRHDGEVVTVRVVDDGPGFVQARRPEGGLRVSVEARMAHAGGAAQVTSTPGQGTAVTLTWPTTTAAVHGTAVGPLAEVWCSVRDKVSTQRRARLEETVVPLLRRLADADTRLDDDLRTEAGLAEQAVRDEMHLPEVLDAPTRETVRTARARGCRVRLQSDSATGVPVAQVNAVLQVALSAQPVPHELTLSVYTRAGRAQSEPVGSAEATESSEGRTRSGRETDADHVTGQATVAVVAVPGSPARRDALHLAFADRTDVLADAEDATWAEIRISG